MQLPIIIILFGLMLELVEFNETYKIKSYKHYNPYPWRRPHWHPLPKHRKRYHHKRMPPQKYHYEPEPERHRYASYHEDSAEASDHDKPYIIVIQLPNKNEKKNYHSYERKHVIDPPQSSDYIDDAEELKVYQLDE
ncbi:hypothetical protein PUN28_007518 [Cardiocondyla obscurior]|uniref:Uncharacterized protein n=1 Tax=Cardiocondyla obscurior TaxID=286306 RepID=A0AAW2G3M1_9HYME